MLPNVVAYSFNYGKYHLGTYLIFLTHFGHIKYYSHSSTSKTQFHRKREAGGGVGREKKSPYPLPLLFHMHAAGSLKPTATEGSSGPSSVALSRSNQGNRVWMYFCRLQGYLRGEDTQGQPNCTELHFPQNSDPLCHLTNNLPHVLVQMLFCNAQHLIINPRASFFFRRHYLSPHSNPTSVMDNI